MQHNMTNIALNENLTTTPSLNLQAMPSYSNLNPNANCFVPKSMRQDYQLSKNINKPIFKITHTKSKRSTSEHDEMLGAPVKKQAKFDIDQ
jgi:hypothetical protein